MSKICKTSLIFSFLIILLFAYILVSAQKINTKQARIGDIKNNAKEEIAQNLTIIPTEIQEKEYTKSINEISKDYQSFIDNVNKKIDLEQLDADNMYMIFTDNETAKMEQIHDDLESVLVPEKYKEFHLLFSRSLLKLSIYIDTSDPKDMLTGLELFEQAREEYNRLNIG